MQLVNDEPLPVPPPRPEALLYSMTECVMELESAAPPSVAKLPLNVES
jgi:hypothetical protein